MKIFGVAPSRRSAAQSSTTSPDASAMWTAGNVGQQLTCSIAGVEQFVGSWHCADCRDGFGQQCVVKRGESKRTAPQQELSDGCLRLLARMKRDPPVDISLESPPLRAPAEVNAVIAAAAAKNNAASVRTLSVGPWGEDISCSHAAGCSCGPSGDTSSADADLVLRSLAQELSVWQRWSLKSFAVLDLRLSEADDLLLILRALPRSMPDQRLPGVQNVRLSGLGLGPRGWLPSCMEALRAEPRTGLSLDISNNGITDNDVDVLLPMLRPQHADVLNPSRESVGREPVVSKLNLGGNPKVTSLGLQSLLATASLEVLDLSECSLGPEGAYILASSLRSPGCKLQDLVVYRTGLGSDGVRQVVEASARAPELRSLNVIANAQHGADWVSTLGARVAAAIRSVHCLHVLKISCPEAELSAARKLFDCTSSQGCDDRGPDVNVSASAHSRNDGAADIGGVTVGGTVAGDGKDASNIGVSGTRGKTPRVILVPNEQNNYNRALFLGHVH